jgi:MFS family permease
MQIRNRGLVLFLCSASFFIGYFSRLSWGVLSAYSTLNPTISDDGVIFSLFFLGYTITQIPSGFLADRIPPKTIITSALVGLAFATWLSGAAWTIQVEIVASFATGVAAGCVYSPSVKILASIFHGDELSVAIGYYSLAFPLAIFLTGLALPPLASSIGWRFPYYVLAVVSLLLAILMVPTTNLKTSQEKLDFLVFKDRNVILLAAAGFVFFFAYWLLTLYSYSYLLTLELSKIEAGVVYSMLALAGLPSTLVSGHIMKRIGAKRTLFVSVVIYAFLLLLFSLSRNIWSLIVVSCVMGFFRFIITPASTTVSSLVGGKRGEKTGSVNGITNFFSQASGIVGPLAASFLIQSLGYNAVWLTAFGLSVLASVLYSRVKI